MVKPVSQRFDGDVAHDIAIQVRLFWCVGWRFGSALFVSLPGAQIAVEFCTLALVAFAVLVELRDGLRLPALERGGCGLQRGAFMSAAFPHDRAPENCWLRPGALEPNHALVADRARQAG